MDWPENFNEMDSREAYYWFCREDFYDDIQRDAEEMSLICHWWDHELMIREGYEKLIYLVLILRNIGVPAEKMIMGTVINIILDEICCRCQREMILSDNWKLEFES